MKQEAHKKLINAKSGTADAARLAQKVRVDEFYTPQDDMKNELKKIISEKKKNKTLTGTIIDEDEVNNLPDDSNEFVGEILQDDPKHTSPFTDIKESMVDALNGLNNYCKNKNIQKQ